jgi:CRP/FNR family transcriptional regulator, cyclic AMP receptor protein
MEPLPPEAADLTATLARVPLFAGMRPEEIGRIAAITRRRRYPKSTAVVWQGDPGTTMYVIESGRVKVVISSPRGQENILKLLGQYEFFGDIAMFDGQPRTADVVTLEESRLLVIERDALVVLIKESPGLALGLLAALAGRLRYDVDLLQDAAFLDGLGRLAKLLLQFAGALDPSVNDPVTIPRRLVQADIASLIGSTRESVNRWLGYFERQGFIRQHKSGITILRTDELRKLII